MQGIHSRPKAGHSFILIAGTGGVHTPCRAQIPRSESAVVARRFLVPRLLACHAWIGFQGMRAASHKILSLTESNSTRISGRRKRREVGGMSPGEDNFAEDILSSEDADRLYRGTRGGVGLLDGDLTEIALPDRPARQTDDDPESSDSFSAIQAFGIFMGGPLQWDGAEANGAAPDECRPITVDAQDETDANNNIVVHGIVAANALSVAGRPYVTEITIRDTIANVLSDSEKLEVVAHAGKLGEVVLSDAPPVAILIDATKFRASRAVLSKISTVCHLSVTATAQDVDALLFDAQVSSVHIKDMAHEIFDNIALLADLERSGRLASVKLADRDTPGGVVTASQLRDGALVFGKIREAYELSIMRYSGFREAFTTATVELHLWSAPRWVASSRLRMTKVAEGTTLCLYLTNEQLAENASQVATLAESSCVWISCSHSTGSGSVELVPVIDSARCLSSAYRGERAWSPVRLFVARTTGRRWAPIGIAASIAVLVVSLGTFSPHKSPPAQQSQAIGVAQHIDESEPHRPGALHTEHAEASRLSPTSSGVQAPVSGVSENHNDTGAPTVRQRHAMQDQTGSPTASSDSILPPAPSSSGIQLSRSRSYLVMDSVTGGLFAENGADRQRSPAGLTKLMTLCLALEALEDGRITLDQRLTVSANAASMEGASLHLGVGSRITVEQAILGMLVRSANDAAVALAESLGGSEEKFARAMTVRAHALGLTQSNFVNASGLPDPRQETTARDMARLTRHIVLEFPAYNRFLSRPSFVLWGQEILNRAGILTGYVGADGVKTGRTDESGYSMVTTATRNGVRLIGVILGAESEAERDARMMMVLDEGFTQAGRNGRLEVPIATKPARQSVARQGLSGPEPAGWGIEVAYSYADERTARNVASSVAAQLTATAPASAARVRPMARAGNKPSWRPEVVHLTPAQALIACDTLEERRTPCRLVGPKGQLTSVAR